MAPKKTNTALAVKKSTPTDLAAPMEDWEIEAQKEAKAEMAKEVTGMARIQHDNHGLKIDGQKVKDNKLPVIVIDYIFTKQYFSKPFKPGEGGTPDCYAYGDVEAEMKPHPQAKDPQHDQCVGCPHNAFGTARQGRGKACSDVRKLAVIMQNDDPDSVAGAEVRALSIPPGSLKNWGKYLRTIPDITPTGNVRFVLTELGWEEGEPAYTLTFKAVDRLTKEMAQAVKARRERARADLTQPWPTLGEEEEKPVKKVKGQR